MQFQLTALRLSIKDSRSSHKRKSGLPLWGLALLFLLVASGILAVPRVVAFSNGQNASIVIGQSGFFANSKIAPLINQSRFSVPYDVKFDSSGNLWVADSADSRVLEFKAPFSSDESASVVLGESSFSTSYLSGSTGLNGTVLSTPEAIAFDSSGNLWVSDTGDGRIVEFKAPFSTGENASLVLGVPNLHTEGGGLDLPASQSDLNSPAGITFDSSGNLWVADSGYYRVTEFKAPLSNGENASVVLGQDNFTAKDFPNESDCPPSCDTPTMATLNNPFDVAFDSFGNLWVADRSDHRVVEFTPPFSDGQTASVAVGGSCAIFGEVLAANCLSVTEFLGFDHSGMLWVSDTGNGRVLGFPSPITSGENATVVLGEPDFATTFGVVVNATQSNMVNPEGFAFDSSGNIWVTDSGLNRVLEFTASAVVSTSTTHSVSQSTVSTGVSSVSSIQTTTGAPTETTSSAAQPTISSSAAASGSGGGVPEFPYQAALVATFTVLVVASYLLAKGRTERRRAK